MLGRMNAAVSAYSKSRNRLSWAVEVLVLMVVVLSARLQGMTVK